MEPPTRTSDEGRLNRHDAQPHRDTRLRRAFKEPPLTHLRQRPQRAEFPLLRFMALPPHVIAGEVDVFLAEWRQVWQQAGVHYRAASVHCLDRPFEINGVPQDDCRRDQVESAGAVVLLLEAAITSLTKPIEEDRPRQPVSGGAPDGLTCRSEEHTV